MKIIFLYLIKIITLSHFPKYPNYLIWFYFNLIERLKIYS